MPLLSAYARKKKIEYFFAGIPKDAQILEIGCGSEWVREYLTRGGWTGYVGLDLVPPADIVGDVTNWRHLGLEPESFDVGEVPVFCRQADQSREGARTVGNLH